MYINGLWDKFLKIKKFGIYAVLQGWIRDDDGVGGGGKKCAQQQRRNITLEAWPEPIIVLPLSGLYSHYIRKENVNWRIPWVGGIYEITPLHHVLHCGE
jgi:hypothetical protein